MRVEERLFIAVRAFFEAVKHFLFTILFVPFVGWLAYKKIGPLGFFVLGAFSGYVQAFYETCINNYLRLRSAAEAKNALLVRAHATPTQPERAKVSTFSIWDKAAVIWWIASRVGLALVALLLLWNLFLIYYRR